MNTVGGCGGREGSQYNLDPSIQVIVEDWCGGTGGLQSIQPIPAIVEDRGVTPYKLHLKLGIFGISAQHKFQT